MSQLLQAIHRAFERENEEKIYDHGKWYTSSEVFRDVDKVREQLRQTRVQVGSQVMIALPNSYEFVVSYLAILHHGAIAVPVNMETPVAELARVMERFQASAAIISNHVNDDWRHELDHAGLSEWTHEGETGVVESAIRVWATSSHTTAGANNASLPTDETAAVLMFTSGTTGKPKGVQLLHRHLYAAVQNVASSHELTAQDVTYCILPLFHINAQVIALLSTLASGGRVVMADKFHASRFWDDIHTHQVTWVSCVPTILSILTKLDVPSEWTKSLRFFRSASAPLTPAIAARLEAMYGVPVIESYGMTEAAGQICINPLPPGARKSGSVGKPHGLSLQIVDDARQPVAPFQVGEIAIRGGNIIEAYVGLEPSPDAGQGPGWIYTGDLGYQDDDGYVFITGRAKEIINRAGEKLSPREIEDVLNAHEDVARSAVIGLPDPLYGERVVAWIVPREPDSIQPDVLRTELMDTCLTNLAKHKCPSQILIARSLPVNATGKVQKHLLREVEPKDMLA